MKNLVLEPLISDNNVLIQYTDNVIIDKNLILKVPNTYQAVVFIDEKPLIRVATTDGKKIIEYGKEFLGKHCKIAFVKNNNFPQILWGFGNVNVIDSKHNLSFKVGANGRYSFDIVEIGKLLKQFDGQDNVSVEQIKELTVAEIKSVGTRKLGELLSKDDMSVIDDQKVKNALRDEMLSVLKENKIFSNLGLNLNIFTVESIHVPEDVLSLMNEGVTTIGALKQSQVDEEKIIEIFNKLRDIESAAKVSEQSNKNELTLENLKDEIERIVENQFVKHSEDLQNKLESSISQTVGEGAKMWEESLLASVEEKLQGYSMPTHENVLYSELSAKSLIENAQGNDMDDKALQCAAGLIYSGIEDSLINKYKLKHIGTKYIIPYEEYLMLADKTMINGEYLLKRKTSFGYETIPAQVYEYGPNQTPKTVEMHLVVRFLKIGLSPEKAKRAEEISRVINQTRHPKNSNRDMLKKFLEKQNTTLKDYMMSALHFLIEEKIYFEK